MVISNKIKVSLARDIKRAGKIGVLMGGPSTEREISLKSGQAVYESLQEAGCDVVAIDIKSDSIEEGVKIIKAKEINCAFIALHGRFGEDGQIQRALDDLGIPYTASGASASELAMDKIASREIFKKNGLAVPTYRVFEGTSDQAPDIAVQGFIFPLVVKPATHGSSIGLSIVDNREDLSGAIDLALSFDARIVIEEYIKGRELTVGILEEEALPVIEVVPKRRFFDYQAKYQTGMTDYIVPAQLPDSISEKTQQAALAAHRSLGCYGCSRVDIILSQDNVPFILEINTIPGLTSTSLLPKAAKILGMDFTQLCLKLINLAYEKT